MATIITKNSSTASSVPAAGSLQQGELAVNVTDKKLYTKDSSAAVVKLVGSLGNQEANAVAITGGTINGTAIGGTTPAAAAFTTASASGGFTGNLTGNASTVTNGVYTTGSYADPAWITSLAGSKITGNISGNAANVTGTVAIANGGTGLTALGTGVQTALGQTVTGSGGIVLAASPSLTTPNLGTPSAVTLTNATGLPVSTGISGLGTNVATALGVSVGSVGSVVVNGGALGTPSSGTLTNATGLPLSTGVTGTLAVANGGTGITAFGSGVATALGVNVGSAGAFVVNGGALGTPSSGTVTNLTGTASININGTVGATTPNTGSFTTLTTSSTVTINGGTANGVAYLNGSKVLTTGSALTFDGTNLSTALGGAYYSATSNYGFGTPDSAGLQIFTASGDSIRFGTRATGTFTELARLNATGLGIGTSSPATKLDVNGDVTQRNGAGVIVGNIQNSSGWYDFKASNNTLGAQISTAAALPIRFLPNGTEQMTLNASGNLGLGVTPSAWSLSGLSAMQIKNGSIYGYVNEFGSQANAYYNAGWKYITSAAASQYVQSSGAHSWYTAASGTAGNTISFTQAMTLDADGDLGIGTTSPSDRLHVVSAARTLIYVDGANATGGSGGSGILFRKTGGNTAGSVSNSGSLLGDSSENLMLNAATNALVFSTGAGYTERARITSGGYFKASNDGTYASSTGSLHELKGNPDDNVVRIENYQASLTGAIAGVRIIYSAATPNTTTSSFLYCNDSTTVRAEIRSNGGLANYSGNNVNLSDRREKTNFAPAKSYLDTICAIPVQTFNYIDQSEDDPGLTLGVVAQDVQAVAPELVMESNWGTAEDPKMRLSIYQTDLQYALMKCIQELKAQNDDLRARVAQLEAK